MKKKVFLVVLFAVFIHPARAYYEFDKGLEAAYGHILSLRFGVAEKLLEAERIKKPGNDLVLLYFNYIDFLKAFISEDEADFDRLRQHSEDRIRQLLRNKENATSPFHRYVQAEMLIQQALVGIKMEENIVSAKEIKRAYSLIEKNEIIFPTFILNKKVSGFLHVLIGAVPSRFTWIIRLAGMQGSVPRGLKELREVYDAIEPTAFSLYRTEILFYLGNIYSSFSLLGESEELLRTMQPLIGFNPLITYVASNILMKQGKNDEALASIDEALKNEPDFPVVFLHYKRGLARLRKLDTGAETDFQYFLDHYKGRNNIKAAYQKLAWIALMNSDTVRYKSLLSQGSKNGATLLDEDKDAAFEAAAGEVVNLYLLRARLLFDGGYYRASLNEIKSRTIGDFPHYHEQLEVTYRLGRIMQLTGQAEKAASYYEMTLKNGRSSNYYYAANSSLLLGLMCEDNKLFNRAEEYYNICLSLNYEQYKNSIDQKAQAGIDRIWEEKSKSPERGGSPRY
jgi:tetratricopeptide (TPR) repeat protein